MGDGLIQVEGLSKSFGGMPVLRGVNLDGGTIEVDWDEDF